MVREVVLMVRFPVRLGRCKYCGKKGIVIYSRVFGYCHLRCLIEAYKQLRYLEALGHA